MQIPIEIEHLCNCALTHERPRLIPLSVTERSVVIGAELLRQTSGIPRISLNPLTVEGELAVVV